MLKPIKNGESALKRHFQSVSGSLVPSAALYYKSGDDRGIGDEVQEVDYAVDGVKGCWLFVCYTV